MIGPLVGATTPLKLQDTLIGGSLSTWGAKEALAAVWGKGFADYSDMERVGLQAVNAATRRGTIIHDNIATILSGGTPDPTMETAPYIYAWSAFVAAERPEFLAVEQMVINPTALYAGTLDFIAKIRGRVALGDVKSGKYKASMALQLAAYSMCYIGGDGLKIDQYHRYWWDGDEDALTPLPTIQDYYILLLRPDGYELVPMTVTGADRAHYLDLVKTYHRMKDWDTQHKEEKDAA